MTDYHTKFSDAVCRELGNYVYRLVDPRNGETFYVGKGVNNRVFAHIEESQKLGSTEEDHGLKLERIREIHDSGLKVLHIIHRHKIPDGSVFQVEAALIDAYTGLTNIQGGMGSDSFGPANTLEIIDRYALPTVGEVKDSRLLLINVNNLQDRSDVNQVYDQVRLSWRLSPAKARQADYVLAVVKGVIVGAFVADEWMKATPSNFPELHVSRPDESRWGFRGRKAPDDVWSRFVGDRGKRIDNAKMRHRQNPIRYWNI